MLSRARGYQFLLATSKTYAHTATIAGLSSLQYRSNAEIISRPSRMVKNPQHLPAHCPLHRAEGRELIVFTERCGCLRWVECGGRQQGGVDLEIGLSGFLTIRGWAGRHSGAVGADGFAHINFPIYFLNLLIFAISRSASTLKSCISICAIRIEVCFL